MGDQKINTLILKSTLVGTEELPLNDSGADRKTTTQNIVNLAKTKKIIDIMISGEIMALNQFSNLYMQSADSTGLDLAGKMIGSGTIVSGFMRMIIAGGSSSGNTYQIYKNNIPTGVICNVTNGQPNGTYPFSNLPLTFVDGDIIMIKCTLADGNSTAWFVGEVDYN